MTDPKKRRDRHEIIAEILKTAAHGRIKTHIMYRAKLSYSQINEYLPFLIEKGLLENVRVVRGGQHRTFYRTTPKGRQFIESLESVNTLWTKSLSLNEPNK